LIDVFSVFEERQMAGAGIAQRTHVVDHELTIIGPIQLDADFLGHLKQRKRSSAIEKTQVLHGHSKAGQLSLAAATSGASG
jgi:hypothetical protein